MRGVAEERGEGAVGCDADVVGGVDGEDGGEMGEDEGVVLEFCEEAGGSDSVPVQRRVNKDGAEKKGRTVDGGLVFGHAEELLQVLVIEARVSTTSLPTKAS